MEAGTFSVFKGMRRNDFPPSPAFISPSPTFEPLNPGHDHRQLLQIFNQPSANISVKTSAQRLAAGRTDARVQSGFAALLNCIRNDWTEGSDLNGSGEAQPDQLFWPE